MDKYIEIQAKYKHGAGYIHTKCFLNVRDIIVVESIPEETSEFQDGIITRLILSSGVVSSIESYETIVEKIKAALIVI